MFGFIRWLRKNWRDLMRRNGILKILWRFHVDDAGFLHETETQDGKGNRSANELQALRWLKALPSELAFWKNCFENENNPLAKGVKERASKSRLFKAFSPVVDSLV